ncbi:MAG TPA: hypothetical protein DCL60_01855 [Armatimonadetes bacterium]|nr:hypothetical protein [Armatimonadota bacterium]
MGRSEKTKTIQANRTDDQPNAAWVRGVCPECGEPLISNCYYIKGKGYLIVWECWGSLKDEPACTYRKIL